MTKSSPSPFVSANDLLQARIDASYLQDRPRKDCCANCVYNYDRWHCHIPSRCTTDRDYCLTCPPCKGFERVRR